MIKHLLVLILGLTVSAAVITEANAVVCARGVSTVQGAWARKALWAFSGMDMAFIGTDMASGASAALMPGDAAGKGTSPMPGDAAGKGASPTASQT